MGIAGNQSLKLITKNILPAKNLEEAISIKISFKHKDLFILTDPEPYIQLSITPKKKIAKDPLLTADRDPFQ